jgi:hypothetical protein
VAGGSLLAGTGGGPVRFAEGVAEDGLVVGGRTSTGLVGAVNGGENGAGGGLGTLNPRIARAWMTALSRMASAGAQAGRWLAVRGGSVHGQSSGQGGVLGSPLTLGIGVQGPRGAQLGLEDEEGVPQLLQSLSTI